MPQHPSRRNFLRTAASAAATPLLGAADTPRPNILWLTWEDIGPHLRCFGDDYSTTPNFDRLAKRGCVYPNTWASAPVCAPARTAIGLQIGCRPVRKELFLSFCFLPFF